ncbi:MAG: hypothetical protein ABI599_13500 [Flavobacteriales bacterium]
MLGALLTTGYTALFLLLIHKLKFFGGAGLGKRFLSGMFVLKVLAGTALWWLYTYHYTSRADSDIYKFFDASAPMYAALWNKPLDYFRMLLGIANDSPYFDATYYQHIDHWYREYESNIYNDAHTMIRFNAFVRIFSFGCYHVHTVFICFLSLIGLVSMHKAFAPLLPGKEKALAVGLFLLPSVLFWGSGLIKESLLMFGLGVFLLQAFKLIEGLWKVGRLVALAIAIILLLVLKFYVLACMLPGLLALLIVKRLKPARSFWVFAVAVGLCLLLGANLQRIAPDFDLVYLFSVKQKDMYGLAIASNAGSLVHVPLLTGDVWSFVLAAPVAFFNAVLGPTVLLKGGFMAIVPALENAALIVALVIAILHRQRNGIAWPMLWFCISYCLLLLLIIGWTTPVMGALVRYRVPVLPFLALIALLVVDRERLLARWPKLKLLFT